MKNKEIQEQRMRGYFIQATKDLLKAEGLKSVRVRTIAERAGYSYTTMYNYFKDINDLIFLCVFDFNEECKEHVKNATKKHTKGATSLKSVVRAYCNFFIQYPGIFELFFIEQISNEKTRQPLLDIINFSLDSVCENHWNDCLKLGIYSPENIVFMKSTLRNMVLGDLLMYLNRRYPGDYTDFMAQLEDQLEGILNGAKITDGKVITVNQTDNSISKSLFSIKLGNNK